METQPILYNKIQTSFIPSVNQIFNYILSKLQTKLLEITPSNNMKVRFISKKQRELIKKNQQNQPNQHPTSLQPIPQHTAEMENGKIPKVSESSKMEEENRENEQEKEEGEEKEVESFRKKVILERPQLNKLQIEERQRIKNNYLGLTKSQKINRHQSNYKSKLLFEWDNSEDTLGGVLGNKTAESLARFKKNNEKVNMDDIIEVRTWKDKVYSEMTERDWRIFREDMEIFIKGGRVVPPFRQWKQLQSLDHRLISNFQKLKFQKPKPIQMQSIPIGLTKKDLVAIAPTGQGKTLGYLIPIIQFVLPLERITVHNSNSGPYSIVLVPSRQLAQQIVDEWLKIKFGNIAVVKVIGGTQLDLQAIEIERACDVIVATPGRLKQLVQKHYLSLNRCSWVVIDEADKMISQNLIEDVEWILDSIGSETLIDYESFGKKKVTHMFSATMVPEIEKLTKKYLVAPVSVTIGQIGGGKKEIQQFVQLITENQKRDSLKRILRGLPGPLMIFVNTRVKCDQVVKLVSNKLNRTVADYHGGKNQQARQRIIQDFRAGKFQVLVATDLGGRGLDIKGISAVISYDAPKNISQFIHRAGRSGRAGVKGKAFTFLTSEDEEIFYDVRTFMQRNQFKIPQNLLDHPASQVKPGTVAQIARRKQIVYTN